MPTYIVKNNSDFSEPIFLKESDQHHLIKVLRAKVGKTFHVTNQSGAIARLKITSVNPLEFEILQIKKQKKPKPITLHLPLIDWPRLEWALQKLTELNLQTIQLVHTEFSQKASISKQKWQRLLKIIETAQIQCGRAWPLNLKEPKTFQNLCFQKNENLLVCHPQNSNVQIQNFTDFKTHLHVFIGPEGGFSDSEIHFFKTQNADFFNFGDSILRTETAAIAITSLMQFCSNDSQS